MRAAFHTRYGGPEVMSVTDLPRPEPGPEQVLVRVEASEISTATWRMRAAAFPPSMALIGRAISGFNGPRNKVPGSTFAGRVVAVGENVANFRMGDAVFGFVWHGAHAEYLVVDQSAAMVQLPKGLDPVTAATLPFGAVTALCFLRDFGKVQPGQSVLVAGGSGSVGVYAVQIAKLLGAHVTVTAGARNLDLMHELGADEVIDYRATDLKTLGPRFDLVFDTVGAMNFSTARRLLKPRGLFLPLEYGLGTLFEALITRLCTTRRMALHISSDTPDTLRHVAQLAASGQIRPVIDLHLPLADIVEAHRRVDSRRKTGAVVLDLAPTAASLALAG